jgi:Flp pilus assembly protein TadB
MTSVTVSLAAGAGIAIGLLIFGLSLRRPRPALVAALARMSSPVDARTIRSGEQPGRANRTMLSLARAVGLDRTVTDNIRSDLRVLGRTPDSHIVRCAVTAIECGLLLPALAFILAAGGIDLPVALPAGLALAFAAGGALMPNLTVHAEADKRRRTFRHALGAYLDLVAMNLAAGRGVETALEQAARSGRGWAFTEIRQALYRANVMGDSPWVGLDHLGQELGIVELRELAASVGLAGDSGARVRASLAAKARTLRVRGLGEIEEAAQSANERMSLPVILLVVSFIVFIAFPATYRIVKGL